MTLTDDEIRVLLKALISAQFYGKESDIAVNLVYKLTASEKNKLDK